MTFINFLQLWFGIGITYFIYFYNSDRWAFMQFHIYKVVDELKSRKEYEHMFKTEKDYEESLQLVTFIVSVILIVAWPIYLFRKR